MHEYEDDSSELKQRLREEFKKTIGKRTPTSAIIVRYGWGRLYAVGVPYALSAKNLTISSFFKTPITPTPVQYKHAKIEIPLDQITYFRRLELPEVTNRI